MYKESMESISLMKLNAYYQDRRFGNKNLMKLFDIKESIKGFGVLAKNVSRVHKQGIEQTVLQVKAYFKPSLIEDHRLKYDFDHSAEIEYAPRGKEIHGKIAVYTSVYGNYDAIVQPLYKSQYCDYFAITDQEIPDNGVWKKYDTSNIPGFEKMDAYHKSKYCKMFPHVLFPDYEYSIWVDGNVQIVADLLPLVDRLEKNHFMGTFQNPLHDCVYTEAKYNLVQNYAKTSELMKQVDIYKKEGFPKNFGMREFSVIVRKHNDVECIDLMDQWWEQVNKYTMRDQISFPYVLWRAGKTIETIQLLGENWRWNPRFMWCPHNWHINYVGKKNVSSIEEKSK